MFKDFDGWNKQKKQLDRAEFNGFVHERDIWWCSLGINVGYEQDGKNTRFERPVLVLKKFSRHLVLTVPITTKRKDNPFYFPFVHDGITFSVVTSQLRLLSTKRFLRKVRRIDKKLFVKIVSEIKARAF